MRYLLVDRVLEWQAGQRIKGLKNVTMSEDFLDFHFPKNPVMPGVLLLEALAQLAGWLNAASSEFQNWFLLHRVQRCMFYGFALPGDTVELVVEVRSGGSAGLQCFSGLCAVNGKRKMIAEFEGEAVPLADLEDVEEQKDFFQVLTRTKYANGL
jgi:3-hydroxyacyl-[acyl-carrier-protein] dehydratase